MTKRLFIFAGYDRHSIIDPTLIHYLRHLSELGDIILTMDCDIPSSEITKLNDIPHILSINCARHGEYDFGSYKRGYQYAKSKKILKKYDWVYFVNDSVYGPLTPLTYILADLESRGTDMVGMVEYCNTKSIGTQLPPHIQSWFIGVSREIATAEFLGKFLNTVTHHESRRQIIYRYEVGLTQTVMNHGYKYSTITNSKYMASAPLYVVASGVPFIKKTGLSGIRDFNMLPAYSTDQNLISAIMQHITRYGYCPGPKYIPHWSLRMFGLTLIAVYKKGDNSKHKYKLFDKITIFETRHPSGL